MRVLMITQKLDPADPVLGFTAGWVRALLSRLEHLDVLCLEAPPLDRLERFFGEYPPNLRTLSMGKERGAGKVGMALGFYRALFRTANHADVIFSHMVPRYTWMAAPVAMAYPIPQLLVHPPPGQPRAALGRQGRARGGHCRAGEVGWVTSGPLKTAWTYTPAKSTTSGAPGQADIIPSEMTTSPLVRLVSVMDPAFRYAEHRKFEAFYDSDVFYYQGTGFIDEVERLLEAEMCRFLGCTEAETRW